MRITRIGEDIVSVTGDAEAGDATDYLRVCAEHHWASERTTKPDLCSHCPTCQVALTAEVGMRRYTRLILAVVEAVQALEEATHNG
jgi:hypothetical protein